MDKKNNIKSFTIDFSLTNGLSKSKESTKRYLSNMNGMFSDQDAYEELLSEEDILLYEFYELDVPNRESDLLFGTSIVYPGKVGNEYFMTKGHFHTILDTAEVYYCLSGNGVLLMENPEGDWDAKKLSPGNAVYVPGRYAHRSINIGEEPLITYYVFRADAGHDYRTIEEKGYRKLVIEKNGEHEFIDNPKWG